MAAFILTLPAQAQQDDGLTPEITQCLRDNASAVEAAEPDLTKATDFLVVDACAVPIAKEQQRQNAQRMQALAERNRAQCMDRVTQQKQQDASATPPRTARTYENCDPIYNNAIANNGAIENIQTLSILGLGNRLPAAIAMAAKLILKSRTAHNKSRP